jgi:hypothetical protein
MVQLWIVSVFYCDCNRDYSLSLADDINLSLEKALPLLNPKKFKIAILTVGVDHFGVDP